VLRTGDGGSTIAGADVITDFTDGTDVFALSDDLVFDDLSISQGDGIEVALTSTVIKNTTTNEYLSVVENTLASSITYMDFIGLSTDPQVLMGGDSNDVLIGSSGSDTISGEGGSDVLLGWGGNDSIAVGGNGGAAFSTYVDGGAGTDTLSISYDGITSLKDLSPLSYTNGTLTFTDVNGGVITASGIEALTVAGNSYDLYLGSYSFDVGQPGYGSGLIWGSSDKTLYAVSGSVFYANSGWLNNLTGFSGSDNFEFVGSSGQDTINFNISRASYSGKFTLNMGDGSDSILSAKLSNTDEVDLGAGDDTIYVMSSDLTTLNVSLLSGGDGTDTLAFEESTISTGQSISLNTGNATGFENLRGSSTAETLIGDDNSNVIKGLGGADTIYGGGGDDTLYAGDSGMSALSASSNSTADILYGGAGNDTLIGSAGANTFDGGVGSDTIVTGGGNDTIVLRTGDGGSTIAGADVITDFTDGTDVMDLTGSLTFGDLRIFQGSGSHIADTIIQVKSTGEYLAILTAINSTNITDVDFE